MMVVPYQADEDGFRSGVPELLFEGAHLFGTSGRNYDVSPDGKRLLVIKEADVAIEGAGAYELVVVLDFDAELERLLPGD